MTQVHDLAHQKARLARALESARLDKGRPSWEPSRNEMMEMRRFSRGGTSARDAYKGMNPPCTLDRFKTIAKRLGIKFGRMRLTRCF
jgi:hypothetical protein